MSKSGCVLALDQGTTGTHALLFDERGRVKARGYRPFAQHYPEPGRVEHDAAEIWRTCLDVVRQVSRGRKLALAAVGITNQRETTVVWDRRTGRPLGRAIVWQDRRTAPECAALKRRGLEGRVRRTTGLVLDPYFSGTKLAWILRHTPGAAAAARAGRLAFGTIDTWLIWNLTGGKAHVTDPTNASRTMLLGLRSLEWDSGMMRMLGIPRPCLPEVRPSAGRFGVTAGSGPVPGGVPITGVAGDQQAALFGQGCVSLGGMKVTYGTGAFLLMHTGKRPVASRHNLLTTAACDPAGGPAYALEGSVFIAGAAVQWLRDEVKLVSSAPEADRVAETVPDTAGVHVVPAFTGLGAPWWDPGARGTITGLTRGANRAHIVRATLESIDYSVADVVDAMEKDIRRTGVRRDLARPGRTWKIREFRVDGGASRSRFLMQFQADILGARIVRPANAETTSAGAAYLAGLGAGVWTPADLARLRKVDRVFRPRMAPARRRELLAAWHEAVTRARTVPGTES